MRIRSIEQPHSLGATLIRAEVGEMAHRHDAMFGVAQRGDKQGRIAGAIRRPDPQQVPIGI